MSRYVGTKFDEEMDQQIALIRGYIQQVTQGKNNVSEAVRLALAQLANNLDSGVDQWDAWNKAYQHKVADTLPTKTRNLTITDAFEQHIQAIYDYLVSIGKNFNTMNAKSGANQRMMLIFALLYMVDFIKQNHPEVEPYQDK